MKTVIDFVAALGENPLFVAFNAHCWFAFAVVYVASVHGAPVMPVAFLALSLAAAKEFGFDAHEERNPPQTFWDNVDDFAGYTAGVLLAAIASLFN